MTKYKALISFAGQITMSVNEIKEIKDKEIAEDLLNAGYIEEIKTKKTAKKEK